MLVIHRKTGQAVRVGDALIHVRCLGPNRVKLAIDAPPAVRIERVRDNEPRTKPQGGEA